MKLDPAFTNKMKRGEDLTRGSPGSYFLHLEDVRELVNEGLISIRHPDVRHVGASNVVAGNSILCVVGTKPILLVLKVHTIIRIRVSLCHLK
jgi:hypothetical protein